MKELLNALIAQMADFQENAKVNAEKGNKAAGLRARKLSLEIEKGLKEYRKQSLAAEKD